MVLLLFCKLRYLLPKALCTRTSPRIELHYRDFGTQSLRYAISVLVKHLLWVWVWHLPVPIMVWFLFPYHFLSSCSHMSVCLSLPPPVSYYTVKKASYFPVPSQEVTYQTLPGRGKLKYSQPGRVWLLTSWLGTGKSLIFFYSVTCSCLPCLVLAFP